MSRLQCGINSVASKSCHHDVQLFLWGHWLFKENLPSYIDNKFNSYLVVDVVIGPL